MAFCKTILGERLTEKIWRRDNLANTSFRFQYTPKSRQRTTIQKNNDANNNNNDTNNNYNSLQRFDSLLSSSSSRNRSLADEYKKGGRVVSLATGRGRRVHSPLTQNHSVQSAFAVLNFRQRRSSPSSPSSIHMSRQLDGHSKLRRKSTKITTVSDNPSPRLKHKSMPNSSSNEQTQKNGKICKDLEEARLSVPDSSSRQITTVDFIELKENMDEDGHQIL